jgi:Lon protease-like protein
MNEDLSSLEYFQGTAPLFPLPNLVLFPGVMQGLHIFEPRYREMTADALADDRLIALALLRPGWEADYDGRPDIHPVVCLGRIAADQRLEDGRYNLQVRGLVRARIAEEVENGKLYRSARVQLISDVPIQSAATDKKLRRRLIRAVPGWCSVPESLANMFQKLLQSNLLLGTVCDILSYALPLPIGTRQELLEIADVEQRIRHFLHFVENNTPVTPAPPSRPTFPPDFSTN